MKSRLGYEWKNIYRVLLTSDSENTGKVTRKQFENAVHQYSVFLSKEELNLVYKQYGYVGEPWVDYQRISDSMGLI
jgi:hypothetical protein